MQWFDVGDYQQKATKKEITCTCKWITMEISRYPKHPNLRKDCKHIREVRTKMGQEEIYRLLKKEKKWMTIREIAESLNAGSSAISNCINKLCKQEFVIRKESKTTKYKKYFYQFKIK